MLRNKKIVITGATGSVALPIAVALAADNEVWAAARFTDPAARAQLEAAGVHCAVVDLASGDFSALPERVDHVLNFAVSKFGDFDEALTANAEAVGLLMAHFSTAESFFHCSTTGVYEAKEGPMAETDPLGDNHRRMLPTYSITKIAAEAVVRTMAREHNLPTTIARLNVPYGDNGGWPAIHLEQIIAGNPIGVHPTSPAVYNPIHTDDLVATLPKLLAAASVPATIVNWGGSQQVRLKEWCDYIGGLIGKEVTYADSPMALESVEIDTAKLDQLTGGTRVDWKEGMKRMVAARHPELAPA